MGFIWFYLLSCYLSLYLMDNKCLFVFIYLLIKKILWFTISYMIWFDLTPKSIGDSIRTPPRSFFFPETIESPMGFLFHHTFTTLIATSVVEHSYHYYPFEGIVSQCWGLSHPIWIPTRDRPITRSLILITALKALPSILTLTKAKPLVTLDTLNPQMYIK